MAIEDTMAQLANSQVMQSMPSMRDFVQGFQLIDSDEESNSAIGVLVALMGETCIYIPAIYKNGKIFQMDIMYVPELDQFFPATDNWISYLKSKKPDAISIDMGKKDSRKRHGSAGEISLDLPFNMVSKMASSGNVQGLLEHAAECMVEVLLRKESSDMPYIPSVSDVIEKVAAQTGVKFVNAIVDFPTTSNAFARYYTDEDLLAIAKKLDDKHATITADVSDEDPVEHGEVKLLTSASAEAQSLSDLEKAKILRDGAIVKDTRGLVPTKVYKAKQNNEWQSVGKTGMYELLRADGTTLTAYVIADSDPKHFIGGHRYFVIPLDEFNKRVAIGVKGEIVGQAYPFELSQIKESDTFNDLKNMQTYSVVVIDTDGTYAIVRGLSNEMTLVKSDTATRWTGVNADCYLNSDNDKASHITSIEQVPGRGKLRCASGVLYMPETCRIAELEFDTNGVEKLGLATKDTMMRAISDRSQGLRVKIHNADGVFTVSDDDGRLTDNLNKSACAYKLVKDYFVTPEDADIMIKEASAKNIHQERFLLKIADDALFSSMFSGEPEEQHQMDSVDLDAVLPVDDRKALEIAANSGVKEVFDVETLRVLAQADSSVREIQDYIPALFTAMDRIARILYLARAGESIAEAYGEAKASQIEAKFKHLLVAIGDAIICLQQGRVDNVHDLLEGDLSNTIG